MIWASADWRILKFIINQHHSVIVCFFYQVLWSLITDGINSYQLSTTLMKTPRIRWTNDACAFSHELEFMKEECVPLTQAACFQPA